MEKILNNIVDNIKKENGLDCDLGVFLKGDIDNSKINNVETYNKKEVLRNILEFNNKENSEKSIGALMINWICNYGASLSSNNSVSMVKRTGGYHQTDYWSNKIEGVERISDWFMGKLEDTHYLEIEEKWKSFIIPLLRFVETALDPCNYENKIIITIPPFSCDMLYPNWKKTFKNTRLSNIEIVLEDEGKSFLRNILLNTPLIKSKKAIYCYNIETDVNEMGCYIVSLYDISDKKEPIQFGAWAYVLNGNNIVSRFPLQFVNCETINISEEIYISEIIEEFHPSWDPIKTEIKSKTSTKEKLKSLSPHFADEYWSVNELYNSNTFKLDNTMRKVKDIINHNGALSVFEICERLLNKTLSEISVGDTSNLYFELDRSLMFLSTTLRTKRESKNCDHELPLDFSIDNVFTTLPCTYNNFEWKTKTLSGHVIKYTEINANNLSVHQLIKLIVEYCEENFDHCTTYVIAEEFYAFQQIEADPSATFTAKLFKYLSDSDDYIMMRPIFKNFF